MPPSSSGTGRSPPRYTCSALLTSKKSMERGVPAAGESQRVPPRVRCDPSDTSHPENSAAPCGRTILDSSRRTMLRAPSPDFRRRCLLAEPASVRETSCENLRWAAREDKLRGVSAAGRLASRRERSPRGACAGAAARAHPRARPSGRRPCLCLSESKACANPRWICRRCLGARTK